MLKLDNGFEYNKHKILWYAMAEKVDEIIEKKMLKPGSFSVYHELYAAREKIITSLFPNDCVRYWDYACDVAHETAAERSEADPDEPECKYCPLQWPDGITCHSIKLSLYQKLIWAIDTEDNEEAVQRCFEIAELVPYTYEEYAKRCYSFENCESGNAEDEDASNECSSDKTEDDEYDETNEIRGCSILVNDQIGEELGLHIIFGWRGNFNEFLEMAKPIRLASENYEDLPWEIGWILDYMDKHFKLSAEKDTFGNPTYESFIPNDEMHSLYLAMQQAFFLYKVLYQKYMKQSEEIDALQHTIAELKVLPSD